MFISKTTKIFLVVSLAGGLLASCAGNEEVSSVDCPKPFILADAERMEGNASGGWTAALNWVDLACEMDGAAHVEMALFFSGRLYAGSAGQHSASLPVFIAFVSPGDRVISRQVRRAKVRFNAGKPGDFVSFRELVEGLNFQIDAVPPGSQVIVGFALTGEELAANQAEKQRRLGY